MSEEKYRPVEGDRVRVVLEGEVVEVLSRVTFTVGAAGVWENLINQEHEHVASVEKLEPPVEMFTPGTVVRSKASPDWLYTVGEGGWLSHTSGNWTELSGQHFTSRNYERVEMPK